MGDFLLFNRIIELFRMVDDASVACAERSYCHVVDREALWDRVTGKKGAIIEKKCK